MKIREKLMHKYALSEQGAADMLKAFAAVTVSDLVLMMPVSLLYFLVKDYMEGNRAASRDTVVLPPPDGPMSAVTCPCFAVKDTSFNTTSPVS